VRETRPPALVVTGPDGKLVHRVERMGVFNPHVVRRALLEVLRRHPRWRPAPARPGPDLRAAVLDAAACGDVEEALRRLARAAPEDAWARAAAVRLAAARGPLEEAEAAARALPDGPESRALLAEVLLRRGRPEEVVALPGLEADEAGRAALAFALERLGRPADARPHWSALLASAKAGPLAARARLRLATDGPRAAEWETLDEGASDATSGTTLGPAGGEAAAVRWLLAQQEPDGTWRGPRGPHVDDGVTVARTALCARALRAWREAADRSAVEDALRRAHGAVDRWSDAPKPAVWDLTYALDLLLERQAEAPSEGLRRRVRALLSSLASLEHGGGWTYTGPARLHTFNTAPVLLLLVRARDLGFEVDPARLERAAAFLARNRVGKSSVFHYGTTMEHMSGERGKTDAKSTAMRSALCELALHVAGAEKGTRRLEVAVDLWFDHQASARATQKIFESYVDVTNLQDSYRYFFGTRYAARAIAMLPEPKRARLGPRLAKVVRDAQEYDGSFVDSQATGKASSTALALLALAEVRAP
jgi:hypothetical protein